MSHETLWLKDIYQECDGFYYYEPPRRRSYSSQILRAIADKLDEMNKPWEDQLESELNPNIEGVKRADVR